MLNKYRLLLIGCFVCMACCVCGQHDTGKVRLLTAKAHPMKYYLSLPDGWSPAKKWPVVVTIEDAEKKFKENAALFAGAGKRLPFIIVTPVVVTNGNYGYRSSSVYPYSADTWARIDKEGICQFDLEGLMEVLKDVAHMYNGEDKVYLTGFEAGAHLVWAMTFIHPEKLYAAAPVAGNYRERCITADGFSKDPSVKSLPVRSFYGANDEEWKTFLRQQDEQARNLAASHGYANVSITQVPGKTHTALPDETLEYFYSLYKTKQ